MAGMKPAIGTPKTRMTKSMSQIDQYIILSMELPGEASDLKHTIFPDVFIVDYIKVYKKKLFTL